jgi:hypothetical protein
LQATVLPALIGFTFNFIRRALRSTPRCHKAPSSPKARDSYLPERVCGKGGRSLYCLGTERCLQTLSIRCIRLLTAQPLPRTPR